MLYGKGARCPARSRPPGTPPMITRARSRRLGITDSDGRTQTMPGLLPRPSVGVAAAACDGSARLPTGETPRGKRRCSRDSESTSMSSPPATPDTSPSRQAPPPPGGERRALRLPPVSAFIRDGRTSMVRPSSIGVPELSMSGSATASELSMSGSATASTSVAGERVCTYLLGGAALMNTTSRKRKNRHGFARLGWPPATAHTGAEHICTGLIEASPRAWTFEALRRRFHARAPLGIPGTSWPAVLHSMPGNPGPGPTHTAAGRGVLPRPIIGGPLSDLPDDEAPLAEDAARRQGASRFTGSADNPRSHGGATVAPPSKVNGKTWDGRRAQRSELGHRTGRHRRTAAPRRRSRPPRCSGTMQWWTGRVRCCGAGASCAGRHPGPGIRGADPRRRSGTSRCRGIRRRPRRTEHGNHPRPHLHPQRRRWSTGLWSWSGTSSPSTLRRRAASQFSVGGHKPRSHGAATVAAPCERNRSTTMPGPPVSRAGAPESGRSLHCQRHPRPVPPSPRICPT